MKKIQIDRSPSNPYYPGIDFNPENGVCEISGESYMEEAYKFYLPLINWIKEFIETQKKKITLNIKLIYFNTSTTKCLLDVFEILKRYQQDDGKAEINWFYDKDDPDMVEEVKDFEREADVKINIQEL